MTIDEFLITTGPYLRKGYVAMDAFGLWRWYSRKPFLTPDNQSWCGSSSYLLSMFKIEPVDNWRESRRMICKRH